VAEVESSSIVREPITDEEAFAIMEAKPLP
jgi:hypothetical protein